MSSFVAYEVMTGLIWVLLLYFSAVDFASVVVLTWKQLQWNSLLHRHALTLVSETLIDCRNSVLVFCSCNFF